MKRWTIVCIACFCTATPCMGAAVTVDVTIKVVNPQARGITVVYKTELGEKTIELDVSRKAEITVNGKEGSLDSLGVGLKAKVSFDRDLAIVTKIEAKGTATATKAPELVEVSELNDEGSNDRPSLSADGLTIFWARFANNKIHIWTAHRDDSKSVFTDKKPALFSMVTAVVSSDGLEVLMRGGRSDGQEGGALFVATREDASKQFGRPTELTALTRFSPGFPLLSPDGLTLYFGSGKAQQEPEMLCCTRKDKSSPWSNPQPCSILKTPVGCPFLTEDGLHLFGHEDGPVRNPEGNLLVYTRSSKADPFRRPHPIRFDSLPPLFGNAPKYVSATHELFFARYYVKDGKRVKGKPAGIWVVRNVDLADLVK